MKTNKYKEGISKQLLGYRGIGIRRSAYNRCLDVSYSLIWSVKEDSSLEDLCSELFASQGEGRNGLEKLSPEFLQKALATMVANEKIEDLGEKNRQIIQQLQNFFKTFGNPKGTEYYKIDFVSIKLFDLNVDPENIEDVYFRLHLISSRYQLPHTINLNGLFGLLPTLVWTNQGPILTEDFEYFRNQSLWGYHAPLIVTHLDKFPFMLNYVVPEGIRIGDVSRVRLGAYLGFGSTVMPAGYVNFNAGTKGPVMIEGRISSGVLVDGHSDIGGGASIMGTLSGGNKNVIEIGSKCLLGANAGTGISLGFGCTIAAGTYVTAGSKVYLYDKNLNPIGLSNNPTTFGNNICKAIELSGRDYLLFYFDTIRGHLVCRPNPKTINLNPQLHAGAIKE